MLTLNENIYFRLPHNAAAVAVVAAAATFSHFALFFHFVFIFNTYMNVVLRTEPQSAL